VWHLDGYDKLKPYGFAVHCCVDGYVPVLRVYICRIVHVCAQIQIIRQVAMYLHLILIFVGIHGKYCG